MARFYIDHDVSALTVVHLRLLGNDLMTPLLREWNPPEAAREISLFVASKLSVANELYVWHRTTGWRSM